MVNKTETTDIATPSAAPLKSASEIHCPPAAPMTPGILEKKKLESLRSARDTFDEGLRNLYVNGRALQLYVNELSAAFITKLKESNAAAHGLTGDTYDIRGSIGLIFRTMPFAEGLGTAFAALEALENNPEWTRACELVPPVLEAYDLQQEKVESARRHRQACAVEVERIRAEALAKVAAEVDNHPSVVAARAVLAKAEENAA